MNTKVSDVFKTTGRPTVTYVQRESGALEKKLRGYIEEGGQLCLITGPSKTGKTTLYKQVLNEAHREPLVVQCTKDKKCEDIWKEALEGVNFERASSSSAKSGKKAVLSGEFSGQLGWSWLAKAVGKGSLILEKNSEETEIRERILSRPSPDLLIPILKHTHYVLIIEDFHYLDDKEKVLLFQQWKRFIDCEISILVLGTTHRAVDIAQSNPDLVGRIAQIDVKQWTVSDLIKICESGFQHLKSEITTYQKEKIASESVGLPILTQQICLEIYNKKNIYTIHDARKQQIAINDKYINSCLNSIASERYSQFGTYFNTLVRGPRENSRKYKTYELVLYCFTIDPIQFDLTRSEIDKRIATIELDSSERPPAASINSTLGALKQFQDRREFQLLEWRPSEDKLYIVEPSFLFYVRWRENKEDSAGRQLDFLEILLNTSGNPLRKG